MANGNGSNSEKKRRILGLLAEDQPGIIERLAGLFLRRGFNIDTIIAGKTAQEGISHVVVSMNTDSKTLEQVEKQVYKIIEVVKVNDLTENSIIREHCLIKVTSTEQNRKDILNFTQLNGAQVLDANHKSIIVEIVSEPEKIDKFVEALKPFGIKELSRTGINALAK
ncbi:MAG: acetolactate synthase small subunit [archaeon]|jgi:acetolactate synthase-1/3 small subunit